MFFLYDNKMLFLWATVISATKLPKAGQTYANANQTDLAQHMEKRVINGENAAPLAFPWAVSIKGVYPGTQTTTYCGASLISEAWLLTAAHCFIGKTSHGDT
ncbi:unnamed protein product [Protopolystoma xenopodis]|uniref:Peptidase S1 domain-containing protein n=1 Tax=Protopolystoma xenopodis TaxID=117903 RepID=A0A448WQQ3_9PLAT|nr:unnamed protein product [Protopolystoma xenopodis]